MLGLAKDLRVEWSREFLMPGLLKLVRRYFSDEELEDFFVLAQHDDYGKIKKLALRGA